MQEVVNKNRRNFLKIVLIGGGALLAGKILGPLFSRFMNGPSTETDFKQFKTVENNNSLTIYDKTGNEIFIMDNQKE